MSRDVRLTALLQEGEFGGMLQTPDTMLNAIALECLSPCFPSATWSKDIKGT